MSTPIRLAPHSDPRTPHPDRPPAGPGQPPASTDRQWWTQQWLDLINSYRFKKRLERGWKYAREGNVLSIRFERQRVYALVQGTEATPYKVSLWLDALQDEDWEFVIESLSRRALFSATLLAGEMPTTIEEVFATNGLRLFPFNLAEVHSRCSCPDKANPCKHVSAVYYLMGDRFSEDPFVLFQLRGRTREQILEALRQRRGAGQAQDATPAPTATPLQLTPESFWQYREPLDPGLVVIVPSGAETILQTLGPLPRGAIAPLNPEQPEQPEPTLPASPSSSPSPSKSIRATPSSPGSPLDVLETIYQSVAQRAMLQAMQQTQAEMQSESEP